MSEWRRKRPPAERLEPVGTGCKRQPASRNAFDLMFASSSQSPRLLPKARQPPGTTTSESTSSGGSSWSESVSSQPSCSSHGESSGARAAHPHDPGSRLVPCPCCGERVHRLLINDHLERCTGLAIPQLSWSGIDGGGAGAPNEDQDSLPPQATEYSQELSSGPQRISAHVAVPKTPSLPPPSVQLTEGGMHGEIRRHIHAETESETESETQPETQSETQPETKPETQGEIHPDGALLVDCPLCSLRMRNDAIFAHLDVCSGVPGVPESGGSRSAGGAGSSDAAGRVTCPICERSFADEHELGEHIDSCDGGDVLTAEQRSSGAHLGEKCAESSEGGSEAAAAAQREHIDKLADELRCTVCIDLFEDPHSLPCQHTFCKECILGCFAATSSMQCPLCKMPCWKRQLTPNHTMASVVQAFKLLQAGAATECGRVP